MSFRTILVSLVLLSAVILVFSGFYNFNEQVHSQTVAFYNVENLFDTVDDPHKSDNDYLPASKLQWTQERYNHKLERIAEVVSILDKDGLALLGLAEVENQYVLKNLVHVLNKGKIHFDFILEEGNDPRGIDVALLYNRNVFKPIFHKVLKPCWNGECIESRDILAVKGIWNADTVWVFVNHWPSRRSGQEKSEHKRMLLSRILKHTVDSVSLASPMSKLIIMGDFNDLPTDLSIKNLTKNSRLENVFDTGKLKEEGSLKYKNSWMLFDQILLSKNFISKSVQKNNYQEGSAQIFNPLFLHYKKEIKNGPYRTYRGHTYYGGYSDHFPVYLKINY
jgi:predicted extracellular nuclease